MGDAVRQTYSLGAYLPDVEKALADIRNRDLISRVWRKDHTVWKPDPKEIANRLGWLGITEQMHEQISAIQAFGRDVRDSGYRTVVLLGMGGSSLGPEVLRRTFGSAGGYPELLVLDSTVPSWVRAVTEHIEPAKTVFLVSSKSGTTVEPRYLLSHFRSLVEQAVGAGRVGEHFVAVTDPGTPLAKMAEADGFRQAFLNASDIGGRYSVLSYFGLVPAALMGLEVTRLLSRADDMRKACASHVPDHDNPGVRLGAAMGSLALRGRDKLTIMTSPGIASFGLWVEQLIAESTGKEGKGIVPVAGEPLLGVRHYGDDRLFVYLRMEGDDNDTLDGMVEQLQSAGQPVVTLPLQDKYDLGAEFFRWEFATAIAGAIIGIHPFDQPNVQAAKDATERVLQEYSSTGSLPERPSDHALSDVLRRPLPGKYLAIMAYIHESEGVEAAIADLRRQISEGYGIATTFGYGPRFLHSTGQLHKGGPDNGLFLQILERHDPDISIPGEPYSFGVVADAQALGDYQALRSLGRKVVGVRLDRGDEAGVRAIADQL